MRTVRFYTTIAITAISFAAFASCKRLETDLQESGTSESEMITINLDLIPDGMQPATKNFQNECSNFENEIKTVTICAYDKTGYFAGAEYYSFFDENIGSVSITLPNGSGYTIFALVNTGNELDSIPLFQERLINNTICYLGNAYLFGLPMAGFTHIEQGTTTATINLRRKFAKFNITIDHSQLPPGYVFSNRSIRVCKGNHMIRPFIESVQTATNNQTPEFQDREDNLEKTGGGRDTIQEVTLYVPENIMGDLLPNNTVPALKTYEALPYPERDCCTYIEFTAVLENGPDAPKELIYRFFPGEDNTSNFNIWGNKIYNIRLVITPESLEGGSWKVSTGDWK